MLAREAIERFVDYDEWFLSEVERGIASSDCGELLSHGRCGCPAEDEAVGETSALMELRWTAEAAGIR